MCGVNSRTSCRSLFKVLGILTTASQYIYSLMKFVINNISLFPTNSSVHTYNTRNKNDLHKDLKSLTLVQKGVHYSGTHIFNNLPATIKDLATNKDQFKRILKDLLVANSFYSIDKFLNRIKWFIIFIITTRINISVCKKKIKKNLHVPHPRGSPQYGSMEQTTNLS